MKSITNKDTSKHDSRDKKIPSIRKSCFFVDDSLLLPSLHQKKYLSQSYYHSYTQRKRKYHKFGIQRNLKFLDR